MARSLEEGVSELTSRTRTLRMLSGEAPGKDAALAQARIMAEGAKRATARQAGQRNIAISATDDQVVVKAIGPQMGYLRDGLTRQRNRGIAQVQAGIIADLQRKMRS